LSRGTLAVDCGANVGRVTARLAERGADVIAFEPNPHAYALLVERFAGNPRVCCRPQAVAARAGSARLYLHENAPSDQVGWSSGSSLLKEKPNVNPGRWMEVEAIDLDVFLRDLDRPVQLLKLDIEGAEIEVLAHLLASGRLSMIDHVLVEMHDTRIPELAESGTELRRRLAAPSYRHVRLDWP
jgi:FkbM family methyltransferase